MENLGSQLHTHSRCFVSSCAIGVHIFHLFFHSSSDLSLKTQGRVALLRVRVSSPAQKNPPLSQEKHPQYQIAPLLQEKDRPQFTSVTS